MKPHSDTATQIRRPEAKGSESRVNRFCGYECAPHEVLFGNPEYPMSIVGYSRPCLILGQGGSAWTAIPSRCLTAAALQDRSAMVRSAALRRSEESARAALPLVGSSTAVE